MTTSALGSTRRRLSGPRVASRTAPEWVDLITPDLKNAQVVLFSFTGHGVLGKSTCAPSIMAAFLDDPMKPVDPTCAAQTTLTFTR